MEDSSLTLLQRLADPDPDSRTQAIREVRYRNLKDPELLAQILALCCDLATVAGQSSSVDPFAAFFDGAPPGAIRVADVAAERLLATGLPTDNTTVETLASALRTRRAGMRGGERLAEVIARSLGETRWDDVNTAVRSLFGALEPYDVPLFHAITLLPQDSIGVLIERAISPARPRLMQELMNHEPSRPRVISAIRAAAPDATAEDVSILAPLLASWGDSSLAGLCEIWAVRFPWVCAWAAVEDPAAGEALTRWLADGAPGAPVDLFPRVSDVLRRRGLPPVFPLGAWLRAAGDDLGLLDDPSVEAVIDDEIVGLLRLWIDALPASKDSAITARGWRAVGALARTQRHTAALPSIVSALERTEEASSWDAPLMSALAGASPAVPGFERALVTAIRSEPALAFDALSALLVLDERGEARGLLREVAEIVLSAAEAAEIEEIRIGKATVRRQRVGITPEKIRPLIDRIADPLLSVRLEGVSAVVGPG